MQAKVKIAPGKLSLQHFAKLMGEYGLYQHARGDKPRLEEGYCTDDNARAVTVLLNMRRFLTGRQKAQAEVLLGRCWKFLHEAEKGDSGEYWNFRTEEGEWLESGVSEDMYARVARTLATAMKLDREEVRRQEAAARWQRLKPKLATLVAPRARAEVLVACDIIPRAERSRLGIEGLVKGHLHGLKKFWWETASADWPWFENILSYANALLPHGLLAGIKVSADKEAEKILQESAKFLIETTIIKGEFCPVGNDGWYLRERICARNDQQPIEANHMFEFLADFGQAYPGWIKEEVIRAPYNWFWQAGYGRVAVARPEIGAAHDGLSGTKLNANLGAESMLAYLGTEVRSLTRDDNK